MLDIDKNETDIHSLFLYPLKYQYFILNQNCQVKFGIIFLQFCGSMYLRTLKTIKKTIYQMKMIFLNILQ